MWSRLSEVPRRVFWKADFPGETGHLQRNYFAGSSLQEGTQSPASSQTLFRHKRTEFNGEETAFLARRAEMSHC